MGGGEGGGRRRDREDLKLSLRRVRLWTVAPQYHAVLTIKALQWRTELADWQEWRQLPSPSVIAAGSILGLSLLFSIY